MSKIKGLRERVVGKAKQAAGEIIGDQDLHEDGKAQAASGCDEEDKSGGARAELNPLRKLNQLT